ncbi:hypothetical protein [uncultured Ruegeria sp.]|uniref:hypothetical protein n=1 Tax=uncultured Ruegeria sp. TaxID=259304 RepID=UPI002619B960|nr:hypothetical protein [uncultured Ruegeria sp.]
MSRICKLGLNGVVFLMAVHFLATPGYAQPIQIGSDGVIAVGGKHLNFHKHGNHKIKRYYVAPKAKSHVKHPKLHHKKPTKIYRKHSPKRRVIGHVPYRSIKRHKFKSYRFKHSYGFKRH